MNRIHHFILLLSLGAPVLADEGMWTFEHFPSAAVKQKYGVQVDAGWLQRLQRSVTRHESGCTGSFVSANGLVLTNHHCVLSCLAALSSAGEDLIAAGFKAAARGTERRCPSEILSVLHEVEDVTATVNAATAGLDGAHANEARKQALSRLEADCSKRSTAQGKALACESVTLYQGGICPKAKE